jgi:hypothetical protein
VLKIVISYYYYYFYIMTSPGQGIALEVGSLRVVSVGNLLKWNARRKNIDIELLNSGGTAKLSTVKKGIKGVTAVDTYIVGSTFHVWSLYVNHGSSIRVGIIKSSGDINTVADDSLSKVFNVVIGDRIICYLSLNKFSIEFNDIKYEFNLTPFIGENVVPWLLGNDDTGFSIDISNYQFMDLSIDDLGQGIISTRSSENSATPIRFFTGTSGVSFDDMVIKGTEFNTSPGEDFTAKTSSGKGMTIESETGNITVDAKLFVKDIKGLDGQIITIGALTTTASTIEALTSTIGTIGTLNATTGAIDTLTATTAIIDSLTATTSTISNLITTNVNGYNIDDKVIGLVSSHSDVDIVDVTVGQSLIYNGSWGNRNLVVNDLTDFETETINVIESRKGISGGIASLNLNGKIPASEIALSALTYCGTWNVITNVPEVISSIGDKGCYYVIEVGGVRDIDGQSDWEVSDWIIFNGDIWEKVDNTDAVSSVQGRMGNVVILPSDVGITNVGSGIIISGVERADYNAAVTKLTGITDVGSGVIISSDERTKLTGITDVGSGEIISGVERAKLTGITDVGSGVIISGVERANLNAAKAKLDTITDVGSGEIISGVERTKLTAITNTGSGVIISGVERAKLTAITNTGSGVIISGVERSNLNDAKAKLDTITDVGSGIIISGVERADYNAAVTKLNTITNVGSGAIITSGERAKLDTITSTGSGVIISSTERTNLNAAKAKLDTITNVGSGIIISGAERSNLNDAKAKLDTITSTGSGVIISSTERTNLNDAKAKLDTITNVGSGVIISSGERSNLNDAVTKLNTITNVGSGAIITSGERTKLTAITNTGSGVIISGTERTNLNDAVTKLNTITNVGSGAIITSGERTKLTAITNTGSGVIISGTERTKLTAITNTGSGIIISGTERTDYNAASFITERMTRSDISNVTRYNFAPSIGGTINATELRIPSTSADREIIIKSEPSLNTIDSKNNLIIQTPATNVVFIKEGTTTYGLTTRLNGIEGVNTTQNTSIGDLNTKTAIMTAGDFGPNQQRVLFQTTGGTATPDTLLQVASQGNANFISILADKTNNINSFKSSNNNLLIEMNQNYKLSIKEGTIEYALTARLATIEENVSANALKTADFAIINETQTKRVQIRPIIGTQPDMSLSLSCGDRTKSMAFTIAQVDGANIKAINSPLLIEADGANKISIKEGTTTYGLTARLATIEGINTTQNNKLGGMSPITADTTIITSTFQGNSIFTDTIVNIKSFDSSNSLSLKAFTGTGSCFIESNRNDLDIAVPVNKLVRIKEGSVIYNLTGRFNTLEDTTQTLVHYNDLTYEGITVVPVSTNLYGRIRLATGTSAANQGADIDIFNTPTTARFRVKNQPLLIETTNNIVQIREGSTTYNLTDILTTNRNRDCVYYRGSPHTQPANGTSNYIAQSGFLVGINSNNIFEQVNATTANRHIRLVSNFRDFYESDRVPCVITVSGMITPQSATNPAVNQVSVISFSIINATSGDPTALGGFNYGDRLLTSTSLTTSAATSVLLLTPFSITVPVILGFFQGTTTRAGVYLRTGFVSGLNPVNIQDITIHIRPSF